MCLVVFAILLPPHCDTGVTMLTPVCPMSGFGPTIPNTSMLTSISLASARVLSISSRISWISSLGGRSLRCTTAQLRAKKHRHGLTDETLPIPKVDRKIITCCILHNRHVLSLSVPGLHFQVGAYCRRIALLASQYRSSNWSLWVGCVGVFFSTKQGEKHHCFFWCTVIVVLCVVTDA